MPKRISYLRVSSLSQDFARQAPATVGCAVTFFDKVSGKSIDGRLGLQKALKCLEKGDTLVVWEMWRLGRSVVDVRNICEDLLSKGVSVEFVSEKLILSADESSPMAKATSTMILTVMAACGEFDRSFKAETCRQGIKVAKAKGVQFGAANPKYRETYEKNKPQHKATRIRKDNTEKLRPVIDSVQRQIKYSSDGLKLVEIADNLNAEGLTTLTGKPWSEANVSQLIRKQGIQYKRKHKHG